jgi:hypothetical protein
VPKAMLLVLFFNPAGMFLNTNALSVRYTGIKSCIVIVTKDVKCNFFCYSFRLTHKHIILLGVFLRTCFRFYYQHSI